MKIFICILLYIIGFSLVSVFISQLPEIINDESLFKNQTEIYYSLTAGIIAGIFVGFFNLKKEEIENDNN